MRRILLTCVPLGLVVGVALLSVQGVPAAQEATPPGEAAAVTLELLGSVPTTDVPGKQLVLYRATLGPGAAVPSHVHPGQLVITIESGTIAYTPLGGEGKWAGAGTPTAAEVIAPGTEVMLGPGDWFIEDPAVEHAARNAEDEPVVLLIAGLVAADQPFLQPMDMAVATPAA